MDPGSGQGNMHVRISNSDYHDMASGDLVLGIVFYQLLINTIDFDKQAYTSDDFTIFSYDIIFKILFGISFFAKL